MPNLGPARERLSFANLDEVLALPDLIAVQRDSFEHFLDEARSHPGSGCPGKVIFAISNIDSCAQPVRKVGRVERYIAWGPGSS